MSSENPMPAPETGAAAQPAATPQPASSALVSRLGLDQQLVVGGAAAIVIADILGAVTQSWDLGLNHWLLIIASLAAAAMVLTGSSRTLAGLPARTLLKIDAAIVGAYGLVELGDLLSSLTQWDTIDIVLTIVEIAGAAALAYGCWRIAGASLAGDLAGAGRAVRLEMADRFVYLGAAGVILGWFLLMAIADVYNFTTDAAVVVLAAVLVLAVRWVSKDPAAGKLPVSAPWAIAGLAAIAVLLGLWWLLRVIGETLEIGDLTIYLPLLVYVLALASLALGAFLNLGAALPEPTPKTEPPAPPPAA